MRWLDRVRNWWGDRQWVEIGSSWDVIWPLVKVAGDDQARPWQWQDQASIIASWQRVAVLEVPDLEWFQPGFATPTNAKYRRRPVMVRGGRYRMRIGNESVAFWARDSASGRRLAIRLITITNINDPAHQEPLV